MALEKAQDPCASLNDLLEIKNQIEIAENFELPSTDLEEAQALVSTFNDRIKVVSCENTEIIRTRGVPALVSAILVLQLD